MENQFTTTFIPKKPIVESTTSRAPVSRPVGILSSLSLILFLITIGLGVGVYFWEQYTAKNVALLSDSVSKVEKEFEPGLITQLQSLDKQLKNAQVLFKSHTVMSPIFDLLESSTLKQVQYSKFDLVIDDQKNTSIKMSGIADGYESIAQQADVLGASSYIKNAIFSNFFLNTQGRVTFDLSFGVTPDFINFQTAPIDTGSSSEQPI